MNVIVNGTNYVTSDNVFSSNFALSENKECFIDYTTVNKELLKINLFKCSSISGTGRILMYNLFDFLLYQNYITKQTKVSLVPSADFFYVERIQPDQDKLIKYYESLGFIKRENNGIIHLIERVGDIMSNIENYHNRTMVDHEEENQFYFPGGKRRKSKRSKSKRTKSKRTKSKRSKSKRTKM